MEVIFTTDERIMSKIIRFLTACEWHHCGVTFGDGIVYEARGFSGVIASQIGEFKSRGKWASVTVEIPNDFEAKRFAKAQIGKGYDWKGIFSFFFRSQRQAKSRWYCSEYVAAIAKAGGRELLRPNLPNILPRDLWAINPRTGSASQR